MGIVYRARQLKLERFVALKVIAGPLVGDPQFRERFRREATAAAALEHPHVVPVFEADERNGVLYLAMRLIEGVDLSTLIRRETGLEPHRAVRLVEQVASALDAAHARGLVHRDVKPANVLVMAGEGPEHGYLTDFGIAKRHGSGPGLTKPGTLVGTLDYMSPEALRGETVGPASDIYALGCVLYEALAAEVPFREVTDVATIAAHLNEPPPSVREQVPELPEAIDHVVSRALAKDPGERFPSAGALAADALRALDGVAIEGSGASVRLADAPAGGGPVRKSVTVLYSTLTAAGHALDPELRAQALPKFFENARFAIERYGGGYAGPSGDAVVGIFGLPQLHEDDALRAARAALDLHESVASNALLPTSGIATDTVFASDPSDDSVAAGSVTQDASRLCQFAGTGQIVLSGVTRELVRDAAELERLPPDDTEELPSGWRLLSVVRDAELMVRSLDAPLVGREEELIRLRQAHERSVQDSSPGLVTVLGAPGVGKTRLGQEFQRSAQTEATVALGRCLPYGEGITFRPVTEILRQVAGTDPQEGIGRILGREDDAAAVQHVLSELLGLRPASASSDEIFWAVRRFLAAAAEERPLLVIFEDIHWAEPTLLDLIQHLGEWSKGVPLLLVCLARPELIEKWPDWAEGRLRSESIVLEPLSSEQSEALIMSIPGATGLDDDARRRILEAAEGNPLFVEQMLAHVRDQGAPVGDLPVPASIAALLAARLELLAAAERDLLSRASIIGKGFSSVAVAHLLSDGQGMPLQEALSRLVRKEFIEAPAANGSELDEFRFRHMLIRDAAYESLPKRLRGELHERFASWLEETFADEAVEYQEIVGGHLERAFRYRDELGSGDPSTGELARGAAARLGTAGRRALARSEPKAAVNLLERATMLLDVEDPARPELQLDTAHALVERGDFAPADRLLDGLLDAAASSDRRVRFRALVQRSFIALATGAAAETSSETARQAIQVLQELGDDLGLAQAWMLLGITDWSACQAAAAAVSYEHAVEHARRAGAQREEDESLAWVTAAHTFGPTPVPDAIALCEQVLAKASGRRRVQGHVLSSHLSLLKALEGDFDEARAVFSRGQEILEELGLDVWVASNAQGAALIEMRAGDPAAAEAALRRGYEALEQLGEKGYLSMHAAMLARALQAQREDSEAEHFLRIAEAAAASDDVASQVWIRATWARLQAGRGHHGVAERVGREALDLAESTDFFFDTTEALLALAEAALAAAHDQEATALMQAALELQLVKGDLAAAASTRKQLGEVG
jgi:predicted ATPase